MTYVLGAVAGIALGAAIAAIKYFALWRGYMKKTDNNDKDKNNAVLARCIISYFINIVTLFVVFLVRNVIPDSISWIAFIIATALTISALGKLYPISKMV